MKNKFKATLTENFDQYEKLSKEFNVPVAEIVQIDLNRCGVYLKNGEVRENFRVRYKARILNDYQSWYALPVMSKNDTPFMITDNHLYMSGKEIGNVETQLILDTCESSYQRGPRLLNLNSRSRSNCAGCKACIHNYHDFYDDTVIKDKKQLITEDDVKEFFESKNLDVASLTQIAVVTGLFGSEENVVNHMKIVHKVATEKGFKGQLMYFGCEVNSDQALNELAALGNFQLIYAIDNFSKREDILSWKKSKITLKYAKNTLKLAKSKGIHTTISYICGIDTLEETENGFKFLKEEMTDFPIINVYQIQTQDQAKVLNQQAQELTYYLKARKIVEDVFADTKLKPKRWTNYRYSFRLFRN